MIPRLAGLAGLALVVGLPLLGVPGAAARAAGAPPQVPLCASCHGNGGISASPTIPSLAGQKLGYLNSALQDYKDHKRQGASADMMTAIATQLSPADIQALAAYYASLKAN